MTYDPSELISCEDFAALLGIPAETLEACITAQWTPGHKGVQTTRIPDEWMEQGRSRVDVYREATGRNDYPGALEFWKAQREG